MRLLVPISTVFSGILTGFFYENGIMQMGIFCERFDCFKPASEDIGRVMFPYI